MSRFYKQLIFISFGIAILVVGGVLIYSANNKGDKPFIEQKFNEGFGSTAYDSSSNGNNGTVYNATWGAEDECLSGKCLKFDGTGDYVSIPDFNLQ